MKLIDLKKQIGKTFKIFENTTIPTQPPPPNPLEKFHG